MARSRRNYSETIGKDYDSRWIPMRPLLDRSSPSITDKLTTPLPIPINWCSTEGFRTRGRTRTLYELYLKVAAGTEPEVKAGRAAAGHQALPGHGNGPATQVGDYRNADNWTINYECGDQSREDTWQDGGGRVPEFRAEVPMPPSTSETVRLITFGGRPERDRGYL